MVRKFGIFLLILQLFFEIKCELLNEEPTSIDDPIISLKRRRNSDGYSIRKLLKLFKIQLGKSKNFVPISSSMEIFYYIIIYIFHFFQDCMPGSYYFNRTCYYFSRDSQKLTWLQSESFCRLVPLNTTMLAIKSNEEFEFIRQIMINLRQQQNYKDQLVFNIGFNYTKGEWRWINNSTLKSSELNITKKWNDYDATLGYCGTIVAKENNEVILKSTPCHGTDERFICTYGTNNSSLSYLFNFIFNRIFSFKRLFK